MIHLLAQDQGQPAAAMWIITSWTPLQLFLVSCGLSATTSLGSLVKTEGFTAAGVFHCLFFHGPIGGGLGIAAYEFISWKFAWRWPFAAIVAGIAYGGGVVKIPSFKITDLRSILLKALGSDGANGANNNDPKH